jgi:hypothetical protein
MSYSRYFKTATAMAAYRHTRARQNTTFSADTAALATAGPQPDLRDDRERDDRGDHEQSNRHKPLELLPLLTRGPGEADRHRGATGQQGGGHQDQDRGM